MSGGAAGGLMAGIIIANNIRRLKDGIAAATTGWPPLEARGLRFAIEEDRPTLTGALDGVDCAVRIVTDLVHNAHTEVTAELPSQAHDVKVGVYPSPGGVLSAIRDWLRQDLEVGDPEFDQAFLVTARPAGAAASLLSFTIRERLFALTGGKLVALTYRPERVTVLLNAVETDPEAIGTALEIVLEAARWPG